MRQYYKLILFTMVLSMLLASFAEATIHRIEIGNFFFSPAKTTVHPNDTVRWVMIGGIAHTTSSDVASPKNWDSGTMAIGDSVDIIFLAIDRPGPFPYFCGHHPTLMKDTILTCTDIDADGICDEEDNCQTIAGEVYLLTSTTLDPTSPVGSVYRLTESGCCNLPGDANNDEVVGISDLTYFVDFMFNGGGPPQVACHSCS